MVLKALKDLFTLKENRLILVLFLWLILGFTLLKFRVLILGYIIFIPLLAICFILFFVALIFRKDIRKSSWKQILLYCFLAFIIIIPFIFILALIIQVLVILALLSYIFITAIFYMHGCYKVSVDLEEKIQKLHKPHNEILRWIIFIGGTIFSIIFLISIYIFGNIYAKELLNIQQNFANIAIIILVIIIFLAFIGCLTLLKGKQNTWLGLFFIFISIFTLYLMVSVYYAFSSQEGTISDLFWMVSLYFFDVLLILYTMLNIIETKTEVLSQIKIFKFVKTDAILMWLIFSKAVFEFAKEGISSSVMNTSAFYSITVFILFIPLLLIAGIYGIWKRGKTMKKNAEMSEMAVSENKIK